MKEKNFFCAFAAIFLISVISIIPINYYVDFFGIFHRYTAEPVTWDALNDRFIKMRYLLMNDNFQKYDSYLWGSSRIMKADPALTGEKTYNLAVPAGMTEDCLQQLKILIKNGAQIQTVYVSLDDWSYFRSYPPIKNEFRWRSYYDDWKLDLKTYIEYLTNPSMVLYILKEWKGDDRKLSNGKTFLHSSGVILIPESIEQNIEKHPETYVKGEQFKHPITVKPDPVEYNQCLKSIREIKHICDKAGIKMIVFFNPQHVTNYFVDDMMLMNSFKKELVKISPFWDFSGINYVTANNYFWYETSHARAFICDKILDIVSGQNRMTWVPDFGVYVTPENVDAFCEKAVRDRAAYDPYHEQWVPSEEERKVMTRRVNYPW